MQKAAIAAFLAADELTDETFDRWVELIPPSDAETRWRSIPWRSDFADAVVEAERAGTPDTVGAKSGSPGFPTSLLQCLRVRAFPNDRRAGTLRGADEAGGDEARGSTPPRSNGRLLASIHTTDPKAMAAMLEKALAGRDALPEQARAPVTSEWIGALPRSCTTLGPWTAGRRATPNRVNDADGKAAEAVHWLTMCLDGVAYVVWIDGRTVGARSNWKNQLLAGPVYECCAPGLSVDGKGNPVVINREGGNQSNRQIFALLSRNGGKSFGKPVRINQGESKVDG